MNKYEAKIVNALLKKYYERKSKHKDVLVHRRIALPMGKVLKDYSIYNVNLEEKELVNEAVRSLESKGFISSSPLKYSEDYERVYLEEDKVDLFEEYAEKELGITPRSFSVEELRSIIAEYRGKGSITDFYIGELENLISNSSASLDPIKEKDVLKALSFLVKNNEDLYLREASMLIYGDSKYLENNRRAQVVSSLSRYLNANGEDVFEDESLFERFHVHDTDQDICVKGPVVIDLYDKNLDIEGLAGGVSFSIKDIERINSISVNCKTVITVENKTSFLRMNDDCCYIYLGGFATKPQVAFIKKLIANNPNKEYLHFGDIDAGGFWIHAKLCEQTGYRFGLFHMSQDDLKTPRFTDCLKELTDSDIKRLSKLQSREEYADCVAYMLEEKVKLEQEIVSLYLYEKNAM